MNIIVVFQIESILSKLRYLAGGQLTEADVRLFTTLIRFDPVYVNHFKVKHFFYSPGQLGMECVKGTSIRKNCIPYQS